jgi:hypothetical protein
MSNLMRLLSVSLFGLLACRADRDLALGAAPLEAVAPARGEQLIRERFPSLARTVLEGYAFDETPLGFDGVLPLRGLQGDLRMEIPRRANSPIRLRGGGGLEARLWEEGLLEGARPVENAVMTSTVTGASYWVRHAEGFEEWLHLDAEAVTAHAPAAVWRVEGARLRNTRRGVELLDGRGVPRVRVSAPLAVARDGRPIDVRVTAQGPTLELWVDAEGEELLVDPMWTSTGFLAQARFANAVRLLDGRVLTAGGFIGEPDPVSCIDAYTDTAEVYDPQTGAWTDAGVMSDERYFPLMVVLEDGRVLTCGSPPPLQTSSCDIYDPLLNTWTMATSPTSDHQALTLLDDGRVLASGGSTTEMFDPLSEQWMTTGAMLLPRNGGLATKLADGRVLHVAGSLPNQASTLTAEIFDPSTGTWTAVGSLISPLHNLSRGLNLLGDGRVVHLSYLKPQFYDPATATWTEGAVHASPLFDGGTTQVLSDGRVLRAFGSYVAGGSSPTETELYDPSTDTWASGVFPVNTWRSDCSTVKLVDGRVLAVGGAPSFGLCATVTTESDLFSIGILPLGLPCGAGGDCLSGVCVDGVCCDSACDAGPCDACSISAGAAQDGTCKLLTGPSCEDGDVCTDVDMCQSGSCVGSFCPQEDECNEASQCTASGCSAPLPKPDGTLCGGGECILGVCEPSSGGGGQGGSGGERSGAGATSANVGGASSSSSTSGDSTGAGGSGQGGWSSDDGGGGGCQGCATKTNDAGAPRTIVLLAAALALRAGRRRHRPLVPASKHCRSTRKLPAPVITDSAVRFHREKLP